MVLSEQCPDGQPAPGPRTTELMETKMTFSMIDRIAPTFLLALAVFSAFATAGLGVA